MVKKQFFDLGITLFGLVAARGFALLSSILIARFSGASTFGEYSFFISIFIILSEIPNAIDTTFIRFSNKIEKNDSIKAYQLISIIVKVSYALFISIVGWFGGPFIAGSVFNKPEVSNVVQWCVLAASSMCLHTLIIGSFQQKKQFKFVSIIRPIVNMFVFIILVYCVFNNYEINSDVISSIYIYVTVPLAFLSLVILIPKTISELNKVPGLIKRFLSVASILILSSAVGLLANRLDIFVMTSSMTFDEVGQYGAAIRVSILVALVTAAMTTIYVPKASAAAQNHDAFVKYLNMVFNYSLLQTVLAVVIIWQIDLIVEFLFGVEYKGIETVAIVLIFQVLFEAYSRGFQALIQCGPRPSIVFYAAIMKLVLSASLLLYLIPLYGVIGGAMAVAGASGIIGLYMVLMALRDCKPDKHVVS